MWLSVIGLESPIYCPLSAVPFVPLSSFSHNIKQLQMHFLIVAYISRFVGCPLVLIRGGWVYICGVSGGGFRQDRCSTSLTTPIFRLDLPIFRPFSPPSTTLPHFSVEISDKQRRIAIKPRQQKQGLGGKLCGELVNLCRYAVIWNESGEMGGEVAVGENG